MSYTSKNNLKEQLYFLNTLLPLYGINSIDDTTTEIKSSDITKYDEMTELIPTIKTLFKTSIMNLSRSKYKFTRTNAISILKHLCIQAHVLFDITKYPNYYTFALAPDNVLLTRMRENSDLIYPHPLNKYKLDSILENKTQKPIEYFMSLETLIYPYNVKICHTELTPIINSNIIKDILDAKNQTDVFIFYINKHEPNVKYDISIVMEIQITEDVETHKIITMRLPQGAYDIINNVNSIELYNDKGELTDKYDTFHYTCPIPYINEEFKCCDNFNLPLSSLVYMDNRLRVSTVNTPKYFRLNMTCTMLNDKIRKKYIVNTWNGYNCCDGYLDTTGRKET
jgi:hypothetical protein